MEVILGVALCVSGVEGKKKEGKGVHVRDKKNKLSVSLDWANPLTIVTLPQFYL